MPNSDDLGGTGLNLTSTSLEAFKQTVFPAQASYFQLFNNNGAGLGDGSAEAFYYFFTNQYSKITAEHIDSVRKYFFQSLSSWHRQPVFLTMPTQLSPMEAVKHPALVAYSPYLKQLIARCLSENLAMGLVEKASNNQLSLPSPFSGNLAFCQESYEAGLGINCLRFTDGNASFFLMQRISSADGLYFPLENIVIGFGYLQSRHICQLQKKLIADFAKIITYASSANLFYGIIASHVRPGHFYYDIWPILLEIYRNTSVYRQIPRLLARTNHDYLDLGSILQTPHYVVLSSKEIDKKTLKKNRFVVHIGLHRPLSQNKYRYEMADTFLVDKIMSAPSAEASQLAGQLAGCSPLVWIGVEGQKRCWLEQVEGYAYLLDELNKKYPKLGVVFDGWTLAITPSIGSKMEARKDQLIVKKIIKRLNPAIKTFSVVGKTSDTKLYVGNKIDFFITNFSSGSLHVSRLLGKPGFCHTSNKLAALSIKKELQIHPNNHVYLLPQHLVQDQDLSDIPNQATALKLPRSSEDMGSTSYSIDKRSFCQFIEEKLPKVLANTAPVKQRIFLDISWTVHSTLRQYVKHAALGKCLLVFPAMNGAGLHNIAKFSPRYWQTKLLYGNYSFGCHNLLKLEQAHYLVWLAEPIQRCYRIACQFAKNASTCGQPDNISDIIAAGHLFFDNYYVRRISGIDVPIGQCTEAMLNQAIANLTEHFLFIGIEEQHELSLDRLCQQLELDRSLFPDRLPKLTDTDTEIPVEIEQQLSQLNQYDQKLYSVAFAENLGSGTKRSEDF